MNEFRIEVPFTHRAKCYIVITPLFTKFKVSTYITTKENISISDMKDLAKNLNKAVDVVQLLTSTL